MVKKGILSSLRHRIAGAGASDFEVMKTRQRILDNLGSAVVLFDREGMLLDYNDDAVRLLELNRDYIGVLSEKMLQEGRLGLDVDYMEDGSTYEVMIPIDTRKHYFNISFRRLQDDAGRFIGNLYHFNDITTIKELYYELENAATHDRVSGLVNKRVYEEKLKQLDIPENYPLAIAVLNINGLSLINSIKGIDEGDMMVKFVAEVLKTQIRPNDLAVRLDGETVVIMPGCAEAQAVRLMKRVREMVSLQVDFTMSLSIEFGVAVKENEEVDIGDVLLSARNTLSRKKLLSPNSLKHAMVDSMNTHFESVHEGMKEHPHRVRSLAARMCTKLALTDEETIETELLGILHDIGLITVPESIMKKEGTLTEEEWEQIRKHPEAGYNIANINPELSSVASYIMAHHEHWDGKGYPNGLSGMEIPVQVRIISLCDAYDVMTHDTFYSRGISREEALQEIENCAGKQFDPDLVKVFLNMMQKDHQESEA